MNVLSLFSGIGSFEKALTNIGVEYELVGFSEIDKWAIESYCKIHKVDKELNLGDVREICPRDVGIEVDILTHGSPCQSFSIAGKQEGGDEGSETQSSLMWETVRIIKDTKPKVVIWENVRSVLFKNNVHNFKQYKYELEGLGYNNYYKTLNSKSFGIPQNRNRVFVISIRDDVDKHTFNLDFKPEKEGKLRDFLDVIVDDKYYFGDDREYIFTNEAYKKSTQKLNHVAYFTYPNSRKRHQSNTFYDINGLCPTVDTAGGGNREPKIYDGNIFRKLTPRECWRLMGFEDEDFDKVLDLDMSDTQLYKQAGNSIVVDVLERIMDRLLTSVELKGGK